MTTNPSIDPNSNHVAAALDAARPNIDLVRDDLDVIVVAERDDVTTRTIDLEPYLHEPRRPRGERIARTIDGFCGYLDQRFGDHLDTDTTIYADIVDRRLVAILNDDVGPNAGWRDNRVEFTPQLTPAWHHWIGGQGLGTQEKFAETIEAGEEDIVNPTATVMLDIAQTFHASVDANFKKAGRTRDGRTQLVWDEEIEATAGDGMVEIPESFTIAVVPFYGANPVEIRCKLRYRIDRGNLAIGYVINRADEILRQSFETNVCNVVREQFEGRVPVLSMVAPARTFHAG